MYADSVDDELAVIDEKLGAELAGNNPEIASELLQILTATLADESAQIDTLFNDQNWLEMGNKVHKVHGATCYCGVPALKLAAGILERVIKDRLLEEIPTAHELYQYEVLRLLKATA